MLKDSKNAQIIPVGDRTGWPNWSKWGRNWRKPAGGAEGQALVEFALSLPFLIILFLVLVEVGFLLRSHMTVVSSVREGARVVSARGNADPAYSYIDASGNRPNINSTNGRVGADGDFVLAQNVNTALGDERANVILLMTYRADDTEDPFVATAKDPVVSTTVSTKIGYNGFNGQYGVYFNSNYSNYPFQEVFSYTTKTAANGAVEKWFTPTVMTVAACDTIYGTNPDVNHTLNGQTTRAKANGDSAAYTVKATSSSVASTTGAFCGDDTKASYTSTGKSGGINRNYRLGQYSSSNSAIGNLNGIVGNVQQNAGSILNPACSDVTFDIGYAGAQTGPNAAALRCWRTNHAPWYPTLRRALDVGLNPSTDSSSSSYFNAQKEDPSQFGLDNPTTGQRSADYIGVEIQYQHNSYLANSFLPFKLTLTDRAVKIMEPVGGSFQN